MNDIDHKPLKIGNRKARTRIARTDSEINYARRQGAPAEKKISAGQNKAHQGTDHQLIAKIARENEVAPPPRISQAVGQIMQTARKEFASPNGLSQKELAQRVNEKVSVIQDYESGTATSTGSTQILIKLERVLKVRLRGSDIGKPLLRKKTEPVAARGA